ncbi:cuticular protein RR-1 motif 52 [Danaus plexippus plexippus]|uniref:Cuticular protein RR-1 motif 52 n=1 Tax=Danaus plexippus plexippus TaxID=278856 RepID=A0A212F1R4_DANPL|nr:cuticular protein RR-1 motif 52 [Danaus plexippus plexippus]
MKYLIILSAISWATAARLENVYLPPDSAASGGANAGLQTPLAPAGSYQATAGSSQASASSQAQILRYDNEQDDQGWRYAYETSDGTKAEQNGRIIPGSLPEQGSLAVTGSFSYIGNDGQTYSVSYTADENGFHPSGDHLPTPPPIPEEILKSLQLTAVNDDKYNSRKSSYDADAGY